MELNKYQLLAMSTCMGSCKNISYMLLNLQGEVGEFSSKIAKAIRKEDVYIGTRRSPEIKNILCVNKKFDDQLLEWDKELMLEAGDILWQLAGLCYVMGWDLETVAIQNLEKLASRKERGVIDGNGDNR